MPRYAHYYMPTASNSVISISKTATSEDGLIDTYTILFADYSTQTFTVTNGRAIKNVTKVNSDPETGVDTYQITFSDDATFDFTIQNGVNGPQGLDGASIDEIKKIATNGDVVIYQIQLTDGSTHEFNVSNGRGISGIEKVSSDTVTGIDTYRIKFTDGTSTDFEVQNSLPHQKGDKGDPGTPGNGISSIEKTSSDGLVDIYTIYYTDGKTATFTVTNGSQGIQGIQGEQGEDGKTPVITIGENGNWFIDGVDTGKAVQGEKGTPGNGIKDIKIDEEGNLIFTLTDGSIINAGKPQIEEVNPINSCNNGSAAFFSFIWLVFASVGVILKKKH